MSQTVLADSASMKKEIMNRCRADMGEHGAAIVKVCVDEEVKAVNALSSYPSKYNKIISRCMNEMREHGFMIVKVCTDEDIKAEKALSRY
ncbi:MAG: hypothetical protein EOO69_13250 [Moraxellaceae bacterium]|nr:MAG: hypothetical protein EOO69_13250 [Moraxellaceae bacterium]